QERAWAVHGLANVLAAQERYAEAIEYYTRALELAESLPEEARDRQGILIHTCNQLGNLNTTDHPAQAEAFFRRALALLGEPAAETNSMRAALSLNLGMVAQSQGKDPGPEYRAALAILEPAVAAARRIGGEHAALADVYHNLGLLVTSEDSKAAENYLNKA